MTWQDASGDAMFLVEKKMQIQESEQARHDLEFMARMLGLRGEPRFAAANGGSRFGYMLDGALAYQVERAMSDPVASERAMLQISRLIAECEDVERAASNFFAEDERVGHLIGTLN